MVARFLQASLRQSFADKTEMTIFCNLIMEVTSNHRSNIPSSLPYSFFFNIYIFYLFGYIES